MSPARLRFGLAVVPVAFIAAVFVGGACRDLPSLRQGVCGNGVVDPGEDCDQFAPEGQACGAPGTAVACRLRCFQSPEPGDPRCPSGWQCGTDDICRAATGSFRAAGQPISAAVERVLLGDFQGNGRASLLGLGGADAIGAAYARLFYLQEDGSAMESGLLGFPVISPQVRDLSGDGKDDLIFSLLGGIGVLLGQPSQELKPVTYPLLTLQQGAETLALPIHPHPPSILDQSIVIFVSFQGNGAIEALETNETIAYVPHTQDRLAGTPVVADLIQDVAAPCGEMVFAYEGEPEVWLLQPCKADGSWNDPDDSLRVAATLPGDHVVDTGVFLADFDRDGSLDLVVGAAEGASFLALGCGSGGFCADKDDPSTRGELLPISLRAGAACGGGTVPSPESPVAVGNLNGDDLPDVVVSSRVLLVERVDWEEDQAVMSVCPAATKLVGGWTTAKIADLNSDGWEDLIAGSSGGLDLEFYAGTGLDRLNLTRITTPAPVAQLEIGDFDGDLVPDVAVGLIGGGELTGGTPQDALSIAYGRVQQPPEPLVRVGAFEQIDQVVAAHFDLTDAVEELGVVARDEEGLQTVTVFLSSGGRQLLAPFGLAGGPQGPAPESDIEGLPVSLAISDFSGDEELDIASVAIADRGTCTVDSCRLRMWVTPSDEDAKLGESAYSPEMPSEVQPFASGSVLEEVAAFPVALDVDGDGVDDPVLLAPWRDDSGQAAVWWTKFDAEAGSLSDARRLTRGPLRLFAQSHPMVADLDADGQPDVLVLATESGSRRLLAAWGQDGLALEAPSPLEIPEEPSGFALIQADTDELPEVVVVAASAAYLLDSNPSAPRVWESSPIDGVEGGTSVAARDIDGDGVDDLAIAVANGVRIYQGRAALP